MKNHSKKWLAVLVSVLLMMSSFSVMSFSVSAEGKNLISNLTVVDLLRPDEDIQNVNQTWSWENGVLTSLDKNREDSNVVFKIDGLDSTKTYRFTGKLKILEFGSDIGWYGPRIIFRGQNRDDVQNCDYSALCHFQSTEVFVNNFINASTLPYEVTNARAKLNTEMAFDIYVSNERTVIYYGGKLCFNLKNNTRVQKIPLCFGFWTIGCRAQFYDLSLTESEMPILENTSTQSGATTTANGSVTTKGDNPVGTTTKQIDNSTTAKADGTNESADNTTASGDTDATATTGRSATGNTDTSLDESSQPIDGTKTQTGAPLWLVIVIIAAIILLTGAGVLCYFMVIRKKN